MSDATVVLFSLFQTFFYKIFAKAKNNHYNCDINQNKSFP